MHFGKGTFFSRKDEALASWICRPPFLVSGEMGCILDSSLLCLSSNDAWLENRATHIVSPVVFQLVKAFGSGKLVCLPPACGRGLPA